MNEQEYNDLILNKERCDLVRKLALNSPLPIGQANNMLLISKCMQRDFIIIKELSLVGYSYNDIRILITKINKENGKRF